MYGEGISRTGELLDIGVEAGIIEKSGSWYSYNGERIGQGRNNVIEFFKANADICNAVSVKLKDALGLPGGANQKA
jgi:recombination protein RecA